MGLPCKTCKSIHINYCLNTVYYIQPGQARPGQARPGQARPGQARPGQARPGQARPGQTLYDCNFITTAKLLRQSHCDMQETFTRVTSHVTHPVPQLDTLEELDVVGVGLQLVLQLLHQDE